MYIIIIILLGCNFFFSRSIVFVVQQRAAQYLNFLNRAMLIVTDLTAHKHGEEVHHRHYTTVIILSSFYTCYFMRLHIWSDLTLDRLVLLVVVFHPVCLSAVHTVTIAHHISRGLVGIIKIKYFYEKWSRRVLHTNEVDWWRYSS